MYQHPNMLCSEIAKDKKFTEMISQSLEKLFDSVEISFVKNKNLDSKIIIDKKDAYLMVKKNGAYTVYHQKMYSDAPFEYIKDSLKKNSEIYSFVLYGTEAKISQVILDKVKAVWYSLIDVDPKTKLTPEIFARTLMKLELQTSSAPYALKSFFQFLNKQGVLDTVVKDSFLEPKTTAVSKFIDYKEELLISTDFLIDVSAKHKLSVKKKFEFNDLDNKMWQQHNGLVLTDQNCGFYIVKENNTYTYYAWDKDNNGGKKHKTFNSLIKDISENPESLVDNVALKIVDNKIVFVDNAFIYSLGFDIQHTKIAFMEEYQEKIEYPVDIRSYDYQLAYHKEHYGMTEFEFVAQAVITYSGYDYDKEKKVLYSNSVKYEPKIAKLKVEPDTEKQIKFSYCILPKKFSYDLDDKWKAGIIHMVNVLKNDKPVPTVSDSKNKTKDVEKVVEFFEDVISKFENKTKKLKP